jgi:membrane fusion protein, multidrug efflux system
MYAARHLPHPAPVAATRQAPRPRMALVVLALTVALTACSRAPTPPPQESLPTADVRVVTVQSSTHHASEDVVGTVRPRLRASIEARIQGRITRFHAVTGMPVQEGDVLVELETPELRARVEQANAHLIQAEQDLKRFSALLDQQAVTRAEFDAVHARHTVAQAAASEAAATLEHARILAPFTGVVSRKFADLGDLASPGRPLLELDDPQQLRFEAHVPESLFDRIQPDATFPVRIDTLDATLTATVAEIAPAADPASRTSLVKLDLPNTPGLRPGQFGRLLVPTADRAALRVPASAVVQRGQLEFVFVVHQNHAQLRLVKTGKRSNHEIEIVSGIQPGETIVVTNPESLQDGQPLAGSR